MRHQTADNSPALWDSSTWKERNIICSLFLLPNLKSPPTTVNISSGHVEAECISCKILKGEGQTLGYLLKKKTIKTNLKKFGKELPFLRIRRSRKSSDWRCEGCWASVKSSPLLPHLLGEGWIKTPSHCKIIQASLTMFYSQLELNRK